MQYQPRRIDENHSFNINVATEIGVPKAILLKENYGWCHMNSERGKNRYAGFYWTYNPAIAYAAKFPYMNIKTIERHLSELVRDGWLYSEKFNVRAGDHTKSYTVNFGRYDAVVQQKEYTPGQATEWICAVSALVEKAGFSKEKKAFLKMRKGIPQNEDSQIPQNEDSYTTPTTSLTPTPTTPLTPQGECSPDQGNSVPSDALTEQDSEASEAQAPPPVAAAPPPLKTIKEKFEAFRQIYPGKKRGAQTEFDNYKRKYGKKKEWGGLIEKLGPAIEQQIQAREIQKSIDGWAPIFPALTVWVNQRRWEEEPEAHIKKLMESGSVAGGAKPAFLKNDEDKPKYDGKITAEEREKIRAFQATLQA